MNRSRLALYVLLLSFSLAPEGFAQSKKIVSLFIDRNLIGLTTQDCFKRWIAELERTHHEIRYHTINSGQQNLRHYKQLLRQDRPDYLISLGKLKLPRVYLAQRKKNDPRATEVVLAQSNFPLYSTRDFPVNGLDHDNSYFRSANISIGQINLAYHHKKDITSAQLIAQYCSYFQKNLAYRSCPRGNRINARALIERDFGLLEDDLAALDVAFKRIRDLNETETATVADLTFVAAHSTSQSINLSWNGVRRSHTVAEISELKNNSRFWNLYSCRIFEDTDQHNIGKMLMLSSSPTLGVLGSTKTGAMAYPEFYFRYLKRGDTFGKALLNYVRHVALSYSDSSLDNNGYTGGMVFNGDPTLDFHPCRSP